MSQQILTGYTYTLGLSVGGAVTGSLSLSDGIGAAAVPEPSSWLMIGAGLVALQAKRFRRIRV